MKTKTKMMLGKVCATLCALSLLGCTGTDLYLAHQLLTAIAAAKNFFESCVPVVSLVATVALTFVVLGGYVRSLLFVRNLEFNY